MERPTNPPHNKRTDQTHTTLIHKHTYTYIYTRVGLKVSGPTYKRHAKWKILQGTYSATCGEVNVSISVRVEIKGDYIEK